MTPRLETQRLVLREWREGDLDDFARFWADEATARYVGGVKSREDAWRVMAMHVGHWNLRGFGVFALEEKATGAFMGWSGPFCPEGWPENELGWGLLPEFQGRGYATESALAARDFVYGTLGWTTAISLIDPDNHGSLRVAERLGARIEKYWSLRGRDIHLLRHPAPQQLQSPSSQH